MKNDVEQTRDYERHNPTHNVLLIIVSTIFMVIFTLQSPGLDTSGFIGYGNLFIPSFIGLFTIVIYLVSRWVSKNRNWLVTYIGIAINVLISIYLYFYPD